MHAVDETDYCIIIPHFDTWITAATQLWHIGSASGSPLEPSGSIIWRENPPNQKRRIRRIQVFACTSASSSMLPASWPRPVPPPPSLLTAGKHTKVLLTFFCPLPKNWSARWYTVNCGTVRLNLVQFSWLYQSLWRCPPNQPYIFSQKSHSKQSEMKPQIWDWSHGPLPRSRGPRAPPVVHGARLVQDVGQAPRHHLLPHHVHRQQAHHRHHWTQWVVFSSDRSSYSDSGLLYNNNVRGHFLRFRAFPPIYLVFSCPSSSMPTFVIDSLID